MRTDPLDGRRCIVTGASQGLGRAIALRLGASGAKLTLVARRAEVLQQMVEECRELAIEAVAVQGDVRDTATADRAITTSQEAYGGLDVLVNNAGASYSDTFRRAPLLELNTADLQGAMDLNVGSAFQFSTRAAGAMDRGGSIVNIASIVARHPLPAFGFYSAAKAALLSLTELMAIEWAPDIRVNAVLPGHIDTPRSSSRRTPEGKQRLVSGIVMNRLGTPKDVAGAVAYLASSDAAWTTGTAIDVNGGLRVY